MYYSVTQVCRCNEETRTNSSETSLTGQPLYDTSTNELYIGDGETTIQNLSPIQNLKAGSGMTYTNGSVSLNQGTQINAGGIKVWAENNDIYYSIPNGGGGAQLFPIIRTYHSGYNQAHVNYHTLSGTASTQYDTGDRQAHHDDISITLNYSGPAIDSGTATRYATGTIIAQYPLTGIASGGARVNVEGTQFIDPETGNYKPGTYTGAVDSGDFLLSYGGENVLLISIVNTSDVSGRAYISGAYRNVSLTNQRFSISSYGATEVAAARFTCDVVISDSSASFGDGYIIISASTNCYSGKFSGVDTVSVFGKNNIQVGTPQIVSTFPTYTNVSNIDSEYNSINESIRTEAITNINGAQVVYNTPYTYIPDTYFYRGEVTQIINNDAEDVHVSPSSPSDMNVNVYYYDGNATIIAFYDVPEYVGDSMSGSATLSYNTPIYGYYTNVRTYIGSDYGARVTKTSSSVTGYSSGTNGSYFWVNMRAASQTNVSASAVSYWDSWVPAYNSYHYPIELNGVRYNFNTIDLDGVNYTATAEKYSKR